MLENGTIVDGKYEILSKIGQGGMSVVYLALNRKAMKQWAIKEVRRDVVKDFEAVKQSLVVETDMLKKLSHPNLPDIVDIIENDDSFFIVMDYIEGKPLSKRLEEEGAQPESDVVEWAKQLCDVLDYLHTREPAIIYRDMKPSNVMLKPDGQVSLIDFGTAREYKGTNIQDTTCLGTIGYAAPEQFGGQGETDARTDIYCLGATLYHLVTGHSPAEPPYEMYPIRHWDSTLSAGLENIILKCTKKDPNDRYQSCAELKYALEHMEEEDYKYWLDQKKKQNVFLASVIATILCFTIGLTGSILSHFQISKTYTDFVSRAAIASGDDAANLYKQAFDLNYVSESPTDTKENFKKYLSSLEYDGIISSDEDNMFRFALGEQGENGYFANIRKDPDVFCDFLYNVGVNYFIFYSSNGKDANDIRGSAGKAAEWFSQFPDDENLSADAQRQRNMANIYKVIADYYSRQQSFASEIESGESMYKEMFDALSEACYASTEETNEILKFRIFEATTSFLLDTPGQSSKSNYEACRNEGVTTQQITQLLSFISENSVNASDEMSVAMKTNIDSSVDTLNKLINSAN